MHETRRDPSHGVREVDPGGPRDSTPSTPSRGSHAPDLLDDSEPAAGVPGGMSTPREPDVQADPQTHLDTDPVNAEEESPDEDEGGDA